MNNQMPPPPSPVIVAVSPKNVGLAIVLAVFFGPLGMLYATIPGAIILFLVDIVGVLTAAILIGFPILIVSYIAGIIWAAMAASGHNKRLMPHA